MNKKIQQLLDTPVEKLTEEELKDLKDYRNHLTMIVNIKYEIQQLETEIQYLSRHNADNPIEQARQQELNKLPDYKQLNSKIIEYNRHHDKDKTTANILLNSLHPKTFTENITNAINEYNDQRDENRLKEAQTELKELKALLNM